MTHPASLAAPRLLTYSLLALAAALFLAQWMWPGQASQYWRPTPPNCSLDGKRWFPAESDGACYSTDADKPQPPTLCDASLWQHVYNPQRLKVLNACISVTGTIVDATHGKRKDGLRHEPDGDTHGWLKLDEPNDALINAGNKKAEEGNLVFEAVCKYRVKQKDALAACKDYTSEIVVPPVGTHVRITGALIEDDEKAPNHFQWMEIHPVTRIEVLK